MKIDFNMQIFWGNLVKQFVDSLEQFSLYLKIRKVRAQKKVNELKKSSHSNRDLLLNLLTFCAHLSTLTALNLQLFYTCSTSCVKARFGLFQNYVTDLQIRSFRANSSR